MLSTSYLLGNEARFNFWVTPLLTIYALAILVFLLWQNQFKEALTPETDESGEPSLTQKIIHYLSLPWKLLFALIPPTDFLHGYISFVVAIIGIGIITAIIGDVAAHFGCTIGLKDSVTAITIVAMGTSMPDTFASKIAAVQSKTADSSIGIVVGTISINVFLGIGISWSCAAIYHKYHGTIFHVPSGSLGSAMGGFFVGFVICIIFLQYRRYNSKISAELGGPIRSKWVIASAFVFIWVIYIVYSALGAYCIHFGDIGRTPIVLGK